MPSYDARAPRETFDLSRAVFEALVSDLSDPAADQLTHAGLEELLDGRGRDLLRGMLQDHLDLRAIREKRREDMPGADGVPRTRVERGHDRALITVFGPVRVRRLAYRAPGVANLYPADAMLNLPAALHSHGLRRRMVLEAVRGSYDQAIAAVARSTGVSLGKGGSAALVAAAAVDVGPFYSQRRPGCRPDEVTLVMSFDGKGVVMRKEGLRPGTAKAAAVAVRKLSTRLSRGEKANRKRMGEVGAVYDAVPAVRGPHDVLARSGQHQRPAPVAAGKWLTVSVREDAKTVISRVFDEAERRDPKHTRPWVALVDGNTHQIERIQAEAKRRKLTVTIVCDFVHVLEYLWKAGWCFFTEGDPAIEEWVAGHAHRVLRGRAGITAAAIRRKATTTKLTPTQRKNADTAARYLLNLRPHLRYDQALAAGWPIATGIIEGACRHLVVDRMDITGARWGLTGAEAVLTLRALISNGDFDGYWAFHLQQEHQRVHRSRYRDAFTLAA